jgi:hypothetical protein
MLAGSVGWVGSEDYLGSFVYGYSRLATDFLLILYIILGGASGKDSP